MERITSLPSLVYTWYGLRYDGVTQISYLRIPVANLTLSTPLGC